VRRVKNGSVELYSLEQQLQKAEELQMDAPTYEVLALRYATHQNRSARENFIATDTRDSPMPLDYFIWVIRSPVGAPAQRTIVVDTGMDATTTARKRVGELRGIRPAAAALL
jgi:hypothetical protein